MLGCNVCSKVPVIAPEVDSVAVDTVALVDTGERTPLTPSQRFTRGQTRHTPCVYILSLEMGETKIHAVTNGQNSLEMYVAKALVSVSRTCHRGNIPIFEADGDERSTGILW